MRKCEIAIEVEIVLFFRNSQKIPPVSRFAGIDVAPEISVAESEEIGAEFNCRHFIPSLPVKYTVKAAEASKEIRREIRSMFSVKKMVNPGAGKQRLKLTTARKVEKMKSKSLPQPKQKSKPKKISPAKKKTKVAAKKRKSELFKSRDKVNEALDTSEKQYIDPEVNMEEITRRQEENSFLGARESEIEGKKNKEKELVLNLKVELWNDADVRIVELEDSEESEDFQEEFHETLETMIFGEILPPVTLKRAPVKGRSLRTGRGGRNVLTNTEKNSSRVLEMVSSMIERK